MSAENHLLQPPSLIEPVPPGVVCVPVTDAPTGQLVLAWSPVNRSPHVASFVRAATGAEVTPPR